MCDGDWIHGIDGCIRVGELCKKLATQQTE